MKVILKVLAALLALSSVVVQAALYQAGPISKEIGSFPSYYQDLNGLALDLCLPAPNSIELSQGYCLITADNIGDPTKPISFPDNFPDEAFWWNGGAQTTFADGSKVILVMALEAAFANTDGKAAPGDQIVFARIRVKFNAPVPGKYKITYPFGILEKETTTAGEKVFVTEDIGATCGTDFTCASKKGAIGPFLRPSGNVNGGGAPLPFVVLDGKTYIADPTANPAPVTGSPFGTNFFRVDGPVGSNLDGAGHDFVQTNLFTLMGRVHTAPLPSNINVEKAIYSRSADDSTTRINVNVKAIKGLGQPDPKLKLFGEGMPGISLSQNGNKPGNFYGQVVLNSGDIPSNVFVSDILEQPSRVLPVVLVDHVNIKQASYDDISHELHVEAESSDKSNVNSGALKLTVVGTDGTAFGDLVNGVLTKVLNPAIPPAKVLVKSNRGGQSEVEVAITGNSLPSNAGFIAKNDNNVAINLPINVLGNDTTNSSQPIPAGSVKVRIVSPPEHGSVVVNANQTVSFTQTKSGTGSDSFSYYLTDVNGGNVSNVAKVMFNLTSGNLPPTAVADTASASPGATITIDVLANDSDPDDAKASLTVASVTQPAQGSTSIAGGQISYNSTGAAIGSQQSFNYTMTDGHNHMATATVTVAISAPELIDISRAEFRTKKSEWRISGTDSPAALGVKIKVSVDGVGLGETTTDGFGAWDLINTSKPFKQGVVRAESGRGAVKTFSPVSQK